MVMRQMCTEWAAACAAALQACRALQPCMHATGQWPYMIMIILRITRRREIANYREDCEKLDRDPRLHDSAALKKVWAGAESWG